MTTAELTLDNVLALARRLRPVDQARLIARLAPSIEQLLAQSQTTSSTSSPRLRGLLADLGTAPSDADIVDVQRKMWSSFPSEDV